MKSVKSVKGEDLREEWELRQPGAQAEPQSRRRQLQLHLQFRLERYPSCRFHQESLGSLPPFELRCRRRVRERSTEGIEE